MERKIIERITNSILNVQQFFKSPLENQQDHKVESIIHYCGNNI